MFFIPRRGNDAYRAQQWSVAKECYDLAIAADSLRMDVEHLESQEPVSLYNVSIPARYGLGECIRYPSGGADFGMWLCTLCL